MPTYTVTRQDGYNSLMAAWEKQNTEIASLRAELAAMTTVTWIPISDQLPPPQLRVLAAWNDGRMTTMLRALYIPQYAVACDYNPDMELDYDPDTEMAYYPAGWYEAVDNGEYAFISPLTGTVTHWAKLPKLPAQEVQP